MTRAETAAGRFFSLVETVGERDDRIRDDYTLPLFPLALILEADGTLADGARHLFDRYQA